MQNEITELRNQVRTLKRVVCLVSFLIFALMHIGCASSQEMDNAMESWYGYPISMAIDHFGTPTKREVVGDVEFFVWGPDPMTWVKYQLGANVRTNRVVSGMWSSPPAYRLQFTREGLQNPNPPLESNPQEERHKGYASTATGTGFLISKNGYLITAYHVVEDAKKITVITRGNIEYIANLQKSSKTLDLAVLKIEGNDLPFLELSSNSKLELGDEVFTIGFPVPDMLGKDPKYTNGSISSLTGFEEDTSMVQISVPVQPGNSGGPLISEDGEVVGVVLSQAAWESFLEGTGTMPQNINFAVRSEYVIQMLSSVMLDIESNSLKNKNEVIERANDSVCFIRVEF